VINSELSTRATSALLSAPRERRLPFNPEDANAGSSITGIGNSSNIVADFDEYQSILRVMSQADARINECLHHVTTELETMFGTTFILPAATTQCMHISDSVKRSLGQFRSLTDDVVMRVRHFAEAITSIG